MSRAKLSAEPGGQAFKHIDRPIICRVRGDGSVRNAPFVFLPEGSQVEAPDISARSTAPFRKDGS